MPILYKLSPKTGKVQQSVISVLNDTFTVTFGQVDGKTQTRTTTCSPKNTGRSNATTAEEQAIIEAKALHTKKIDRQGYTLDSSGAQSINLPMKVSVYDKMKHKLDFTVGVTESPKLDGVNGEYRLVDDKLILLSRGGIEYPTIPHHHADIRRVMEALGTDALNGELYIHGEHLQTINSLVKKSRPASAAIQFHIFDAPNLEGTFIERYDKLCIAVMLSTSRAVQLIPVLHVASLEDIESKHCSYIAQGYEGLIARNDNSLYTYNTRAMDVMKLKTQLDCERKIVDYTLDKLGHAVFTVNANPTGKGTFKVKMKGTVSERLAIANIADTLIGKWMNLKYEKLSIDGLCTKPVGQYIRECDEHGEPTN